MAEPDAPQFHDRSTPEPVDDFPLQAPLLVAPPLGINRQFLVPLGTRSLTVLEPDLFQPRSAHADSGLFEDSPFFNDPLLTAPSKPAVQSLPSSAEGLSSNSGESVQRSPASFDSPTVSVELPSANVPRSHTSAPLTGAVKQLDSLSAPESPLQHADKTIERQASEAHGLTELPQAAPEQPTVRREIGHYAPPTPPQLSSAAIEKAENALPQISLLPKELEDLPTIEATNLSISFPANEVQRSTRFETNPKPISETGSELAVDPSPNPTVEPEAESDIHSSSEQISAPKVESALISRSEQRSESMIEPESQSISDSHPQAAFDLKSESADHSRVNSTSVLDSDSTTELRTTESTELTSSASASAKAISDPKAELTVASIEENFNSIAPIKDQPTVFSPSIAPGATPSSLQRSQSLQAFSGSTTAPSIESEVIDRQLAQENQPIGLSEQEISTESTVQRSLNHSESTLIPSNELAQNPVNSPEAEIDCSAIEALTTTFSAIQTVVTHSSQFSSTALVSDTTADSGNAAIVFQSASLRLPTSSHLPQAKEFEPSQNASISQPAVELHPAPNPPSESKLEQPNPFISETKAPTELEPQTKPLDNSEVALKNPQEFFIAQPSANQTSVTYQPQSSSSTSVSDTTFESSNAAIDAQNSSPLSPTSNHFLQARKLESSPQSTIGSSASELHSTTNTPSALPLEQPNQFPLENPAVAELEPQTEPQAISESATQSSQAALDSPLTSSIDVIPPTQATPSLKSAIPQAVQVLRQPETSSLIARSRSQPNTEIASVTQQPQHESLLESLPSSSPSSIQLTLQPKSLETTPEITSIDHPLTTEKASLANLSEQGAERKMEAFNHAALENAASTNQGQNLVERSQTLEPSAEASPSIIESLGNESLESVRETPEASIQRTLTTSLEASVNSTVSTEPTVSDEQSFNSQSFHFQPNLATVSRQSESTSSEVKPSELDLQDQNSASFEGREEISKVNISAPKEASDLGIFLESSSTNQSLNLAQASLTNSTIVGSDFDSNPIPNSHSELSLIQAKDLTASNSVSSEYGISETLSTFGIDSASARDDKAYSVEIQPTAQSSSLLAEDPKENLDSSHLNTQNLDTRNLEIQSQDTQILNTQSLEIQSVEAQGLQAKSLGIQNLEIQSSNTQSLETQSLEAQNLELLSKPEVNDQARSSLIQASIDPSTTETEPSDTIASALHETNQSLHSSENAINLAHTEAPSDDSTTDPVAVNLDTISNQDVARERDEGGSLLQSIDSPTQETLQKAPETTVAPASQSFFSQQPEPEPAPSELEAEQSRPLSVNSADIVSSSHSTTVQRSHEASTASSSTTSDTATFNTASADLTQSFLPQVQGLPEDQTLPDVQNPLQSASDAAFVQPRLITQAPMSSEMGTASDDGSSVAQDDGVFSNTSITQVRSLTNHEAIARSTIDKRSPESSLFDLKPPSSPEASPVLPLKSAHQEHPFTKIEQSVETFLSSPLTSKQGNEADRHLASEPAVAHSSHGADFGTNLSSIKNATIADTPTIPLQQQAVQTNATAAAAIADPPTANPSFTSKTPIQRQVTPFVETAIPALPIDSLATQQSKSFAAPSELAEKGSLAARSPQATEPNLTQSVQTDLPQPFHQTALPPRPSTEDQSLQKLEEPIALETSPQALATNIVSVEATHEMAPPAIVQRSPSAEQPLELDSFNAVDDEPPHREAPVEAELDNPAGALIETVGDTVQPEVSTALPLVLQKLSTLEPLTSSANLLGRTSATPSTVQVSSANTGQPKPTPTAEMLLQPKQTVNVDRPTTQWSGFSDLVQRQVTPSARSSSRSTAEQTTAQHSVAAVLAGTGEMIQRQEDQPAEVRVSRNDQTQSTATESSDAVDAKDLEQLAQVIYQQLRQRLRIEQERHGRDSTGRLPW